MIESPDVPTGVALAQAPRVRATPKARAIGTSFVLDFCILSFLSVSDRISFRPSGLP